MRLQKDGQFPTMSRAHTRPLMNARIDREEKKRYRGHPRPKSSTSQKKSDLKEKKSTTQTQLHDA